MFYAPIRPALPLLHCSYSEASYFEGYAFQHIAAYEEAKRLARIRTQAIKALDRRTHRR
jgi:hypothetical protein